ncbi:uncharacterized protein LOC134533711 [Bacillus rossius redtenbacheri]|uniref:uncharacterized protein LOC134533711 n=1 Tax=Bacillus rossius redtenbacheri TaxID=93214 RepID=UPI002FDD772D
MLLFLAGAHLAALGALLLELLAAWRTARRGQQPPRQLEFLARGARGDGSCVTGHQRKMAADWTWQWQSYRCSRPRFLVLRPSRAQPGAKQLEEGVTTCPACQVTIHHQQGAGPSPRAACPFCGQPYSPCSPQQRASPSDRPLGVGVGAGRVRGDPSGACFRLPAIGAALASGTRPVGGRSN